MKVHYLFNRFGNVKNQNSDLIDLKFFSFTKIFV